MLTCSQGYCEGVIGVFDSSSVRFEGKLKEIRPSRRSQARHKDKSKDMHSKQPSTDLIQSPTLNYEAYTPPSNDVDAFHQDRDMENLNDDDDEKRDSDMLAVNRIAEQFSSTTAAPEVNSTSLRDSGILDERGNFGHTPLSSARDADFVSNQSKRSGLEPPSQRGPSESFIDSPYSENGEISFFDMLSNRRKQDQKTSNTSRDAASNTTGPMRQSDDLKNDKLFEMVTVGYGSVRSSLADPDYETNSNGFDAFGRGPSNNSAGGNPVAYTDPIPQQSNFTSSPPPPKLSSETTPSGGISIAAIRANMNGTPSAPSSPPITTRELPSHNAQPLSIAQIRANMQGGSPNMKTSELPDDTIAISQIRTVAQSSPQIAKADGLLPPSNTATPLISPALSDFPEPPSIQPNGPIKQTTRPDPQIVSTFGGIPDPRDTAPFSYRTDGFKSAPSLASPVSTVSTVYTSSRPPYDRQYSEEAMESYATLPSNNGQSRQIGGPSYEVDPREGVQRRPSQASAYSVQSRATYALSQRRPNTGSSTLGRKPSNALFKAGYITTNMPPRMDNGPKSPRTMEIISGAAAMGPYGAYPPPQPPGQGRRPMPAPASHLDYRPSTVRHKDADFDIVKPHLERLKGAQGREPRPSISTIGSNDTEVFNGTSRTEGHGIDDHGFVRDAAHLGENGIRTTSANPEDYRSRENKWIKLMTSDAEGSNVQSSKKLKKLVRSGVPPSVRGRVWQFLAASHLEDERIADHEAGQIFAESMAEHPMGNEHLTFIPLYQRLHSGAGAVTAPQKVLDEIDKDIERCYPDHVLFRQPQNADRASVVTEGGTPRPSGLEDLHQVLRAYARFNADIGYCQGMGRLVGLMLMQMPAEEAFWLMVSTVRNYVPAFFTPRMEQIIVEAQVFQWLLEEKDSKLAKHFAKNDIVPLMYVTQWFMTIYTMSLPWDSVLRIWDIFYYEGVRFLHRVGLAILTIYRSHLLKKCPGTSEIMTFLLHLPLGELHPDVIVPAAIRVRVSDSHYQKLLRKGKDKIEQDPQGPLSPISPNLGQARMSPTALRLETPVRSPIDEKGLGVGPWNTERKDSLISDGFEEMVDPESSAPNGSHSAPLPSFERFPSQAYDESAEKADRVYSNNDASASAESLPMLTTSMDLYKGRQASFAGPERNIREGGTNHVRAASMDELGRPKTAPIEADFPRHGGREKGGLMRSFSRASRTSVDSDRQSRVSTALSMGKFTEDGRPSSARSDIGPSVRGGKLVRKKYAERERQQREQAAAEWAAGMETMKKSVDEAKARFEHQERRERERQAYSNEISQLQF